MSAVVDRNEAGDKPPRYIFWESPLVSGKERTVPPASQNQGVTDGVQVTAAGTDAAMQAELGTCVLDSADPVVAGAFGTWTITYTAGSAGVAPGGGIAVVPPCVHSVRWRLGHVTATTNGSCGVSVRVRNDYPLKYHHAQFPCVFVTVEGAALQPGEEVAVTIGDAGSYIPGFYERARAQEVAMTEMHFQVLVDVLGNASYSNPRYPGGEPKGYRLLPELPVVDVVAGPPARLGVVAPATVAAYEEFTVLVRVEDAYGNVCTDFAGEVSLGVKPGGITTPGTYQMKASDGGTVRAGPFIAARNAAGPVTVTAVAWEQGASGVSNPIDVVVAESDRIYFGDLHTHAPRALDPGHRPHGPFMAHGVGTYAEAFRYARDVSGLDCVGVAWFPPPQNIEAIWSVPRADDWEEYQAIIAEFYKPEEFTPLVAVELSDPTAGHRVILYPDRGRRVTTSKIEEIWPALDGTGAVVVPHHINVTSEGGYQNWRVQDWQRHNPEYQTVLEIAQDRGAFETDEPGGATVIGGGGASAQDALALGHRLGFVGGTDSHHAQPGRNTCSMAGVDFHDHVTGGLTAIIAPELTREAIIQALKERRCYATTGARIVLGFQVDGHGMGEEFSAAGPEAAVTARVLGTAEIARLDVVCNGDVVFTQPGSGRVAEFAETILLREKQTSYLYLRVTQSDGHVAWSSPIWVSPPQH